MNRLPLITSAFLNVTNDCNLACRYCFVEQHPNYMTLDVAKDAVHFLNNNAKKANATPGITFFGGDPTLCWDSVVKPLVWYIRNDLNMPFALSMTTNGVLLDKERIDYLNQYNVGVMLSIDGEQETQDFNRPLHNGSSSFRALKDNISLLLQSNPGMTFRSTLIPETCGHIYENIQFAQACGYTNFFLIPNVFQEWSSEAKAVAEEGIRTYTDYFIDSFRIGKKAIRCSTLEDGLRKIPKLNSAVSLNQCRRCTTAYQKCGLGAAGFGSIDYRGNIYACQEMASCKGDGDPFYIGTIYRGTDDARRNKLIAKFDANSITGDECAKCRLVRICDGGCIANNYLFSGSVNTVSPVYCWWMKLMFQEAIRIVDILGNERNSAFRDYWYSLNGVGGCLCKN